MENAKNLDPTQIKSQLKKADLSQYISDSSFKIEDYKDEDKTSQELLNLMKKVYIKTYKLQHQPENKIKVYKIRKIKQEIESIPEDRIIKIVDKPRVDIRLNPYILGIFTTLVFIRILYKFKRI
jgi:hypothetical protein